MGPAAAKNAPGALGGSTERPSVVIKGRRSSKKALKAARAL